MRLNYVSDKPVLEQYFRSKTITSRVSTNIYHLFPLSPEHNLCLDWRELAGKGKRTHPRIVIGSVNRLVDKTAARQAISALHIDINAGEARIKASLTTVSDQVGFGDSKRVSGESPVQPVFYSIHRLGYLSSIGRPPPISDNLTVLRAKLSARKIYNSRT